MNHDRETMGEQPIFTCQAHVFHIDPKTKRTWITASTKAVSVSFFYDSSRNLYRIISVEGSKAVINSTITPNMSFTQTSQKFGQWSDVRANTVYGLGFSSEAELTKFVEKFQEVKEATKNALAKTAANGSSAATPVTSTNTSPVTGRATGFQNEQLAGGCSNNDIKVEPPQMMAPAIISNIQNTNPESPSHKISNINNIANTFNNMSMIDAQKTQSSLNNTAAVSSTDQSSGPHSEQQLKYENERLKMALSQSCTNAKKWEIELATLKSNNIRLTSALQESTANVDEWKRQLHTYKEENLRLKRDMDTMKIAGSGGGGGVGGGGDDNDINEDMRREIIILKTRIQTLEKELMNQEIELKAANKSLKERNNEQSMKQLCEFSEKIGKHLTELSTLHIDMDKLLHLHRST